MPLVVVENISQDGIAYYLHRAREMSAEEAACVLNNELDSDAVFSACWRVSLRILREKMTGNPLYDWDQMDRLCHWAVTCYLLDIPNVSRRLDHFCLQAYPEPASWEAFPYKGLWYFLLLAFRNLPSLEVNHVFRGEYTFGRMPDFQVPFVYFLSASLFAHEAERYTGPDGLLLTIKGVPRDYIKDVSLYSSHPERREVLIWPFVTFRAGDVHSGHLDLEFVGCTPDGYVPEFTNGSP